MEINIFLFGSQDILILETAYKLQLPAEVKICHFLDHLVVEFFTLKRFKGSLAILATQNSDVTSIRYKVMHWIKNVQTKLIAFTVQLL